MPSYDYRCDECKEGFTVERSMTDESRQHCVSCGSEKASRVWNVFIANTAGSTADFGQGVGATSSGASKKSGCGSCVSKGCGTCH